MNTYVIRIVRENDENAEHFVGVVECIETDKQETFHDMDELFRILSSKEARLPPKSGEREEPE